MTITMKDLADVVSDQRGGSAKDADHTVRLILARIKRALVAGEKVELYGFCSLETSERAAMTGRDPRNGQPIEIPAKRVVKIKLGKAMREALNAPAAPSVPRRAA